MAIHDLYSKRQEALKKGDIDIYEYTHFNNKLRTQVVYIINDCLGRQNYVSQPNQPLHYYKKVFDILCREFGVKSLVDTWADDHYEQQVTDFFMQSENVDHLIDVIELLFNIINNEIERNWISYQRNYNSTLTPKEAVNDLNTRLKEHGVGYALENGSIIRIDSSIIHAEITKPTLYFLSDPEFEGANKEYLKAHHHYRRGNNTDCINECLKSFESVMKIICNGQGWRVEKGNSVELVDVCFKNELLPKNMSAQFSSLRSLLTSGISTIRNKYTGHGEGHTPKIVSDELTRYALNLTGSNIIFLIEQSKLIEKG